MSRMTRFLPVVLVALGLVVAPAPMASAGPVAVAEVWILKATWGKPPSWFKVGEYPTQAACEAARAEYVKHQQLGQYSKCVLG